MLILLSNALSLNNQRAETMTQAEREQENGKEREKEREKEKDKDQQRGVKRPIVPASIPESLQEVRCNVVILCLEIVDYVSESYPALLRRRLTVDVNHWDKYSELSLLLISSIIKIGLHLHYSSRF